MNEFQQFVTQNARWFRGHETESGELIIQIEESLGIKLPEDFRWLLENYGIWHATGLSSLEESLSDTLEAREALQLPQRYFVLENHHDGGVYLLDTVPDPSTGEYSVICVGWEDVPIGLNDGLEFSSCLAYVQDRLQVSKNITAEEHVDCPPG